MLRERLSNQTEKQIVNPVELGINSSLAPVIIYAQIVDRNYELPKVDFANPKTGIWLATPMENEDETVFSILKPNGFGSRIAIKWPDTQYRGVIGIMSDEGIFSNIHPKLLKPEYLNLPLDSKAITWRLDYPPDESTLMGKIQKPLGPHSGIGEIYTVLRLATSDWDAISQCIDPKRLISGYWADKNLFRRLTRSTLGINIAKDQIPFSRSI